MDYPILNISDFRNESSFDYVDDNILFASSVNQMPERMPDSRLQFEMLLYCRRGKFQVTFEQNLHKVEAGQMIIYHEDVVITEFLASRDADLTILGFSWKIVEETRGIISVLWPMSDYVIGEPVTTLSEEDKQVIESYLGHMKRICSSDNERFKAEQMEGFVQMLLYEYVRKIGDEMPVGDKNETNRSQQITRTFLDILATRRGHIRSVGDVASLMNLTPKYLSRVIKENMGEPPLHYIHEYLMRAIEQEMKSTDKPIKEIAFQFRFPSLAFFGKFIKQQTGLSPTDFRARLVEKK